MTLEEIFWWINWYVSLCNKNISDIYIMELRNVVVVMKMFIYYTTSVQRELSAPFLCIHSVIWYITVIYPISINQRTYIAVTDITWARWTRDRGKS